MRRGLLVCLFLLSGCVAYGSMKSDLDACRVNAECSQRMVQAQQVATAAAKPVSDGLLPTFAGYIASLVVGIFGGHTLSKKKV